MRIKTLVLSSAAAFLLGLAILPVDFFSTHHWELCLFRRFLDISCPGCGTLRALSALMHGQLDSAWNYNPLAFLWVGIFIISAAKLLQHFWRVKINHVATST